MNLKEETGKKTEKAVDPEKDGFRELLLVKEAGNAFEDAIHTSVANVAKDTMTRYNQWFPYDGTDYPDDD